MSTKKAERSIEGFLINRVPPSGYVDSRGIRTKHSSAYKIDVYGGIGAGASTTAGAFVIGRGYTVLTVGSTSFTGIGASENRVGVRFIATGVGSGTGTATSGQQFRDSAMAGYGNGYFANWNCTFVRNNLNTTNLSDGEASVVTGYVDKTGEFSFADNFSGAAVKGDEFRLTPPSKNLLVNPITFAAGTTGSTATHEVFTITGEVKWKLRIKCTDTLTETAGGVTIQFGDAVSTSRFIASTEPEDISTGEYWFSTVPTAIGTLATVQMEGISNGIDLGYEVGTSTVSGGTLEFILEWEALEGNAFVVTAPGTATL